MTDFAEENEGYEDDKFMLTPEEEAAFELDTPDDFDWEGNGYDIFGDDALSDNEFDGMLQEILDTGEKTGMQEKPLTDTAQNVPKDLNQTGEEGNLAADAGIKDMVPVPEPEAAEDEIGKADTPEGNDLSGIMGERESSMTAAASETENEEFNSGTETQEDILDLINSIYSAEGETPSEKAEDLLPTEQYGTEDDLEMGRKPEDFSDLLTDISEEDLASIQNINLMDEEEEEATGKKKKKPKKKKRDKPSVWQRLFGNIKTERSEEEIAQMKEKVIADAEAKEAAKEAKIKQAAAEKEEKKKKAAENKAAAAKKKQENAKKKAEEAAAKKEAKDKKKQEVQNLIDAIDEDEGKINRVGAAIVFVFFALVAIAILLGTNIYSYKQSLENARESFEFKHYNEAYEEIAGIDEMKDEDETFALQVMVVMYTYKQLNSFQNYYAAGLYPEALDSLLKGLKRYDKYSTIATVIQVDEDLSAVRKEILGKLEETYSLTEQDALALMAIRDQGVYAQQIYDIASHME